MYDGPFRTGKYILYEKKQKHSNAAHKKAVGNTIIKKYEVE